MLRFIMRCSVLACIVVSSTLFARPAPIRAQTAQPVKVDVDATQARQKIYHVAVTMPAHSGAFTFVYPHWIPGWHSPTGPIRNVVSLRESANDSAVAWRRD